MNGGLRLGVLAVWLSLPVMVDACSSKQRSTATTSQTCSRQADCGSKAPVCDSARRVCVQCLADLDCDTDEYCDDNACQKVVSCNNTLDCPIGRVCDELVARCVQCTRDADCDDDQRCVGSACRTTCDSDTICRSQQQLCDIDLARIAHQKK